MAEAKIMSAKMKDVMKVLQEKFPEEKEKVKPGRGGQFKYIPTQEIIDRLNAAFGCSWSAYEIESKIFGGNQGQPNYVAKRVCIEVADPDNPDKTWRREGWGGHSMIDRYGKLQDIGDCMKSAYSKAFTKAASNFGVALYLWGVDVEDDNAPSGEGYPMGNNNPNPATVTTVNPGAHNPPATPQFNNPGAPSPPSSNNPPMSGGEANYPNMAGAQPNNYVDTSQANSVTPGPNFPGVPPVPPSAQLGIKSSGQGGGQGPTHSNAPHVQQGGNNPIQAFQINAINGMATTAEINPIAAIREALGPEANNIQTVEQLSESQAIIVLQYLKQGPPA